MLYRMSRYRMWIAWIILASTVFTIWPMGVKNVGGWLAALLPLCLVAGPSIRRERILIGGLIALIGVAFAPSGQLHLVTLLFCVPIFLISMWLAPPSLEEPTARKPAMSRGDDYYSRECREMLSKELSRARRFNRSVTVFSASTLQGGTETLEQLQSVLVTQLHNYCAVYRYEDRLLAIIPELQSDHIDDLVKRVLRAIREQGLDTPHLGAASFPADAITSQGLIEIADRRRSIHPVDNDDTQRRKYLTIASGPDATSNSSS